MNGIMKKMKWFIISTLVILLVGMTLVGVLGVNNTVDYSSSYEVEVRVDQGFTESNEVLKASADKYFAEKGIGVVSYQVLDEGSAIIYKFGSDVTKSVDGLESAIDSALDANEKTKDVNVSVYSRQVVGNNPLQVGNIILTLALGVVVLFVVMAFATKLAGALATVCAYVVSALVFVALLGITRIPALPHIEYSIVFTSALAAVLSIISAVGYKKESKSTAVKLTNEQVVERVTARQSKKYLLTLVAVLIASVALIAFFVPYMLYAGLQLAVAGISAVAVSYFITPLLWLSIKKGNK